MEIAIIIPKTPSFNREAIFTALLKYAFAQIPKKFLRQSVSVHIVPMCTEFASMWLKIVYIY